MKPIGITLCVAALTALQSHAQTTDPVTLTADDMFGQSGLYFRAYSSTPGVTMSTTGILGEAGPNQVWDFSNGPKDVIYRFDYVNPTNVISSITDNFPQATLVEVKSEEGTTDDPEYLFFSQGPNGRRVYGAWQSLAGTSKLLQLLGSIGLEIDPARIFASPIDDFPAQISFGQEWQTTAVFPMDLLLPDSGGDSLDPIDGEIGGGSLDMTIQVTQTSHLKADAWGTIILPDELGAFGPGLRINENTTVDVELDDGSGTLQHVETDYVRTYYWLMPGRGIVAAITSTQGTSELPDSFPTALQYWRMFETNKKASTNPGGGCANPDPVADLRIRVSNGQALLSWTKATCATQYRLESTSTPWDATSWKAITTLTNKVLALDSNPTTAQSQRFYRVVSMK